MEVFEIKDKNKRDSQKTLNVNSHQFWKLQIFPIAVDHRKQKNVYSQKRVKYWKSYPKENRDRHNQKEKQGEKVRKRVKLKEGRRKRHNQRENEGEKERKKES